MRWDDVGYIIKPKKFGGRSLIVDVFTKNHGRVRGLIKGTKQKPLNTYQIGIGGKVFWSARLEEHLGTLNLEPSTQSSQLLSCLFSKHHRLIFLQALNKLLTLILPENHAYEPLFKAYENFLFSSLLSDDNTLLAKSYIRFEQQLLDNLGFGLSLSHCAVTGAKENLCYVSPNTGCAANYEAGLPYKDKLLYLPLFMTQPEQIPSNQDLKKALDLTGYFLHKHFFSHKSDLFRTLREKIINALQL